ncbi:hypothetical protein BEP19_09820 [Ammoniphilus oxalaticus]|uniref:Uncharacterized protein n=1 Tax=Ammoniphilus oxalaticus TaxID=66863 RepID=A0A419SFJ1_9BACL|nr:hypothetical protein [Ammoniphilus oxalaticus]RKD22549.1 hypothetical protein BEP19_09820 [Ammoniphilus oxalaticus]
MSKDETPKTKQRRYSKSAFIDAEANSKERLILQVVLEDGKTYTKAEVDKTVKDWKRKEIK